MNKFIIKFKKIVLATLTKIFIRIMNIYIKSRTKA